MPGRTYRLICLFCILVLGLEQAWLTYRTGAMYVPPGEIQAFLVALLGGKLAQTLKPRA
jgi:hypothetical protein